MTEQAKTEKFPAWLIVVAICLLPLTLAAGTVWGVIELRKRGRNGEAALLSVVGALAVVGATAWYAVSAQEDDRAPSSPRTPVVDDSFESDLRTCPDNLEALGPFVAGIDVLYDPAMDWDGDGVSCE